MLATPWAFVSRCPLLQSNKPVSVAAPVSLLCARRFTLEDSPTPPSNGLAWDSGRRRTRRQGPTADEVESPSSSEQRSLLESDAHHLV